jgi:hypothetical protein
MLSFLRKNYLSIDPRTLGLLRIALGCLLLFDLAKRVPILRLFYTNAGLIPNHRVLWRPQSEFSFSYLLSLSLAHEVQVAFALIALIYVCFVIGYRTRLMHVLSWLSLISLQVRTDVLTSGADFAFTSLVLWSAFLPLGRRFSVDAVRESLRRADDCEVSQLRAAADSARDTEPVVSLAVLALLLQLVTIYFFNTVHKNGQTWRDGSAVWWFVHQERIVTWLGLWAREHLPLWVFRALTYTTLVVEGALPILLLSPWGRPWTRRAALLLMLGLHSGMALLSNLGVFSPVMMVYALHLVEARDWELWERRVSSTTPLTRWVSRNCASVIQSLGLVQPDVSPPPAAAVALRRASSRAGQALVLALMLVACSEVLNANRAVPEALRVPQPKPVRATVEYLRLFQGWTMFAPDAPTTDQTIVVDAITSDGRHVDPWNQLAARVADPSLRSIPKRLDHDAAFCDFTNRLPDYELHHEAFRDWILSYHRRTHDKRDRIKHFQVYTIEQDSPQPGLTEPTAIKARVFLTD